MKRIFALVVLLAGVALLAATGGEATLAENVKLHARVGPGFSISVTDASGARVTKLDPGTYEIEVEDESEEHNFHLIGPGVDRLTSVGGMGKESWTVTMTEGTYRYQCDPHSTQMRGSFTVGTVPPTTPPPPAPSPSTVTPKTKLLLTSGPGFAIALKTAAGKSFQSMKLGTYTMVVRDRSATHNAHVVAPGFNRRTTVPFIGSQTWKVKLARPGTLRFLCDPHAGSGMKGSAKIVP